MITPHQQKKENTAGKVVQKIEQKRTDDKMKADNQSRRLTRSYLFNTKVKINKKKR